MGNPLTSEVAAFRWLVVILIGAASVALLSRIFGSIFAIWYGLALIFILIGFIAKGMVYMLGSPESDSTSEDESESDSTSENVDEVSERVEAESDVDGPPPGR